MSGGGAVYICASVALHPTAGGWSLRGGPTTGGWDGVWFCVCTVYKHMSECVCAGVCWACVQKSALISAYMYRPVALVKTRPVPHRACVSGQVWILLFILSNLFKSQMRQCGIKINDCVVDADVKALLCVLYWPFTAEVCSLGLYFYTCVCVLGGASMCVFPHYSPLPWWQEAIGLLKWQWLGTVRAIVPRQLCISLFLSLSPPSYI